MSGFFALFTTTLPELYLVPWLTLLYENVFPNYGVAIILLTLITKVLFYPLTVKQFRSMKRTQALQPKMKELQDKYKSDPKKLQQETMKLWKENDANPFGGCLPALIQLPIFILIFYTTRSEAFLKAIAVEGVNPGFLWLGNLAESDPFYIFPILIALTMYWSQKMMTMDKKQAPFLILMPFMMGFFSLSMNGGVLIYWFSTMFISNIQQRIIFMQESGDNNSPNKPVKETVT